MTLQYVLAVLKTFYYVLLYTLHYKTIWMCFIWFVQFWDELV